MEDDAFFWHTSWFGLLDDAGAYSPVAGEISSEQFGRTVSHNLMKGSSGWKTDLKTLYFSVPSRPGKLTLYCLGFPVAEVEAPEPE